MIPINILFESNYTIKKSNIAGKGIVSTNKIKSQSIIGLAFTKIKNTTNPDKDYKRTTLGKYVNHSIKPNCKLFQQHNKIYYKAINDIPMGVELTLNYNTFPWEGKRNF